MQRWSNESEHYIFGQSTLTTISFEATKCSELDLPVIRLTGSQSFFVQHRFRACWARCWPCPHYWFANKILLLVCRVLQQFLTKIVPERILQKRKCHELSKKEKKRIWYLSSDRQSVWMSLGRSCLGVLVCPLWVFSGGNGIHKPVDDKAVSL